jgi:hypothetical protein
VLYRGGSGGELKLVMVGLGLDGDGDTWSAKFRFLKERA